MLRHICLVSVITPLSLVLLSASHQHTGSVWTRWHAIALNGFIRIDRLMEHTIGRPYNMLVTPSRRLREVYFLSAHIYSEILLNKNKSSCNPALCSLRNRWALLYDIQQCSVVLNNQLKLIRLKSNHHNLFKASEYQQTPSSLRYK